MKPQSTSLSRYQQTHQQDILSTETGQAKQVTGKRKMPDYFEQQPPKRTLTSYKIQKNGVYGDGTPNLDTAKDKNGNNVASKDTVCLNHRKIESIDIYCDYLRSLDKVDALFLENLLIKDVDMFEGIYNSMAGLLGAGKFEGRYYSVCRSTFDQIMGVVKEKKFELQELCLSTLQFDIKGVGPMPSLKSLNLWHCDYISEAGLTEILEGNTSIEYLNLKLCNVTQTYVDGLRARFPNAEIKY